MAKSKFILGAVAAIFASSAAFADNKVYIEQAGSSNTVTITQVGSANRVGDSGLNNQSKITGSNNILSAHIVTGKQIGRAHV